MADYDAELARLIATHRNALLRYAMRRLDDRDAADDLVAETFVVARRRRDRLPPRDEELFWLYGIARRVLANSLRARRRSLRLESRLAFERENAVETPRYDDDDIRRLVAALGHLRPGDRELLELTYWERLSYRQIGLVVGCSEKAAGVRISRARQHLRELLESPAGTGDVVRLFDTGTEQ